MTVVERERYKEAISEVREDFNRLRGRLFETIESFGLKQDHRDAMKNVVRRMTYDMQKELESTLRGKERET